jgi:hypothetical protein
MQAILEQVIQVEPLEKKLSKALHKKIITGNSLTDKLTAAVEAGVLSRDEADQLQLVQQQRMRIINVDDFDASMV